MIFLSCHIEDIKGKTIIKVVVRKGASKPYYFANKGPVPADVYVRQGTSYVQASPAAIKRMIKETDGDIYEEEISRDQNLTCNEALPLVLSRCSNFTFPTSSTLVYSDRILS